MSEMVFWHGWGMRSAAWHSLAHHLKDCPLHLPSLPGYDGTISPSPYTAEAVVDMMLARQDAPVTLCGWSLGAMLALLAAHRHPDRIERLILFGATPSFVQRDNWAHGMPPAMLAEFAGAVHADPESAIRRFIALFNHNDVHSRSNARELEDFELAPQTVLDGGLALLRDLDLRPIASEIRQPTLLVHGKRDPLMPLSAARWLVETMPSAKLDVCGRAAHAPFISDPVHCSALIKDWLATT